MNAEFAVLLFAFALYGSDSPAAIVDSGSTNTPGYRIVVHRSGKTEFTDTRAGNTENRKVGKSLARRFFADLEAARPLPELPGPHCAKSASFGTVRTVEWNGETSPDLTCGDANDPRLKNLIRDVAEILKSVRDKP